MNKKREGATRRTAKIYKIGEKEVDLTAAMPLNWGDWMTLEEQGVDVNDFGGSLANMYKVFSYAIKKANPEITDDDIKGLDLGNQIVLDIFADIAQEVDSLNRPT